MPSILKASEIGAYLYCKRAWWYQKRGIESENRTEMATGTELHLRHGWQVMAAGFLQILGFLLLLVAAVLVILTLTGPLLR